MTLSPQQSEAPASAGASGAAEAGSPASRLPGAGFADRGLDDAEAARRFRAGQANEQLRDSSRTLAEIFRANLFTRFNAILGSLLAVVLVLGPIQDALFGVVLVANAVIGIVQEVRAKLTLDHLAVLSAPHARVVRSGRVRAIGVADVVLGDVVDLAPGDQIVADGVLLTGLGLEVDESLLTGESEAVAKWPGSELLSGGFAVAGTGRYLVTKVGADAYARRLADEARRFVLFRSELRGGIDRILRIVTWVLLPVSVLLVGSQILISGDNLPDAIRRSVAGVGAMIPEGLVLLTSVAFAVGVVRLGRRRVLVKELAAIEGLARVDVVCLDKTGTLTEPDLTLAAVELLDHEGAADALGALAAADPAPNRSLRAVAAGCPSPGWTAGRLIPFSSARKWSGATFAGHGSWILGAADILLERIPEPAPVREAIDRQLEGGRRVLLMARPPAGWSPGGQTPADGSEAVLPDVLHAAAVVALEERIRPEAGATLEFLRRQRVAVKVISGDDPRTVAAVATRVGLEILGSPVDARRLPADGDGLADALEANTVFGRVYPRQKQAMVAALQARGHVVAMTGDGVNDTLALKAADVGVAMGSGSEASRAVARLVLLDDSFAAFPAIVAEGRRVIANVERVANLFVTKTVYAVLLALAVGVARLPFPFYPRHLTVISTLTIGVPAFFLALAPNAARARPGFVRRVLRFALPAGMVAAAFTFGGYALAREEPGVDLSEARTTAAVILFLIGAWVLSLLARPLNAARRGLIGLMLAAFVAVLTIPALRTFFALEPPSPVVLLAAVGIAALADATLEAAWELDDWLTRRRSTDG